MIKTNLSDVTSGKNTKSNRAKYYIGTAAWTLPKVHQANFPTEGSHLERYAAELSAVEINTSFYRDDKASTYLRWAESVPVDFRFSVKLSKIFTHVQGLKEGEKSLAANLAEIQELGSKLGCVLIQLPPKLKFDSAIAETFFTGLRELYEGPIALEPRNASWDDREARSLQKDFRISRVIADPEPYLTRSLETSDLFGCAYFRLHGSPVRYRSDYDEGSLAKFARSMAELKNSGLDVWCIFDNTALGHATGNAISLSRLVASE